MAPVRPRLELRTLDLVRSVTEALFGHVLDGARAGWSPDVALRYLPVVDGLRRLRAKGTVLELGSGSEEGIVPYLKRGVVGVEPAATSRSEATRLAASGEVLPFPDRSFDWSVCVDVLEHVPPERRAGVVSELLRVASQGCVIVVPCDEAAEEQDRLLDETFACLQGYRFPFLSEHVALGLPSAVEVYRDVCAAAEAAGRRADVRYRPVNNLGVRWLLMRLWMSPSPLGQYLYWRTMLAGVDVLKRLNSGPTYRYCFEVRLD